MWSVLSITLDCWRASSHEWAKIRPRSIMVVNLLTQGGGECSRTDKKKLHPSNIAPPLKGQLTNSNKVSGEESGITSTYISNEEIAKKLPY